MVARLLLAIALALLPFPSSAQESNPLEGSWALQIGGTTIFRFDLARDDADGEWHGTWSRPSRFATDGDDFRDMQLPARRIRSNAGIELDDAVEVSFPDPRPGAIPDIFRIRLIDPDAVEMTYIGTGLAPYILQRVASDTALGPFAEGATYSRLLPETGTDPTDEIPLGSTDILDTGDTPVTPNANPNNFRLPAQPAPGPLSRRHTRKRGGPLPDRPWRHGAAYQCSGQNVFFTPTRNWRGSTTRLLRPIDAFGRLAGEARLVEVVDVVALGSRTR